MDDLQEILNKWITTIQTSTKTIQRRRTKHPRKDIKELKKFAKYREKNIQPKLHKMILILQNIEKTYYRKIEVK